MSLLAREGARCPVNDNAPATEIVSRSAVELLALMHSGELSPVEVTDAFVVRAEHARSRVNPFSYLFADRARDAARRSERRLREDPAGCGALEGLPIAIKELTAVTGQPHTLASRAFADHVATATDPAVERLLAAGAIAFARTNTPEFGCASFTDNLLFGETLNPWDQSLSPAGSSGGAAAALAAHATALAQGTDSAGSLRLPAAACGVVGMKPSFGVVPVPAPNNLKTCEHNGPMARDVRDLRLLFGVMAGQAVDQLGAARPVDDGVEVDLGNIRIALIDSMPDLDVDPDVVDNLHRAARHAEAEGASVEHVPFPWSYGRLFETVRSVYAQSYGPQVRQVVDSGAEVTDYARAFSASLAGLTGDYRVNLQAMAETAELHREFARLFARFDVLLLPTMAAPAYPIGDHFIDHGPVVCGREQPDRWIVGFTVAFNIASACPVVTIPTGLSRTHVPTAMQIVAKPYHDHSAISIAARFEALIAS